MRTIICILLWLNGYSQDSPFVFTFKTNQEIGVMNYEVQSSTNQINWALLNTVIPKRKDSNLYQVTLPRNPIWFRVKSIMQGNDFFTTTAVKLDTTFNISNITVKSRAVSFQSDNELNLNYYSILQSPTGANYKELQQLPAKGNSLYQGRRFSNKQRYFRITGFFKNGTNKILYTGKI